MENQVKPAVATAKTIIANVKSIETDRFGDLIVVCNPTEANPKGSFRLNAIREQRLLQRVGIPNRLVLKHVVALSNGTTKLQFTAIQRKAGDVWTNGREGKDLKTGSYTKDFVETNDYELQLGFIAKQKIAEVALQTMFSSQFEARPAAVPVMQPATVSAEAAIVNDSEANTTATEEPNA